MKVIKGFKVISIPLSDRAFHHLFIKEHSDKGSSGKVLFVGNVDILLDMSHEEIDKYLRILFERYGEIESVSISSFDPDQRIDNTRFAHINFNKKSSVKLSLNPSETDYELGIKETMEHLGLSKEKKENVLFSANEIKALFPLFDTNPKDLQEDIDEFMKDYDEQEQLKELRLKELANQPDEDGFITVVRSTKRKLEDDEQTSKKTSSRNKKKKKSLELQNFYRFQIKEQKIAQLNLLRKKFEEDKLKVARMREARKFNPF